MTEELHEKAIFAQQEQVMSHFREMQSSPVGTYGHDVIYQLTDEATDLGIQLNSFDDVMHALNARLTRRMNVGRGGDSQTRTVALGATETGLTVTLDAQQSEQPTYNLEEAHLIAALADGLAVSISATAEGSYLNMYGGVGFNTVPMDTPQLVLADLVHIEGLSVGRVPHVRIVNTDGLRSIQVETVMDLDIPHSNTEYMNIRDCHGARIGEIIRGSCSIENSRVIIGSAGDIDLNLQEGAIVRVDEWDESEKDEYAEASITLQTYEGEPAAALQITNLDRSLLVSEIGGGTVIIQGGTGEIEMSESSIVIDINVATGPTILHGFEDDDVNCMSVCQKREENLEVYTNGPKYQWESQLYSVSGRTQNDRLGLKAYQWEELMASDYSTSCGVLVHQGTPIVASAPEFEILTTEGNKAMTAIKLLNSLDQS